MFWQFESGIVSQIDSILDKQNVTLHELMDEDDILQECKSQNQKLLQFLMRPEIVEEMVTLITKEPPEEADERVRFKYANMACELLTSDVGAINDALVADEAVLNKLCHFLETEKQLNPLLASFFSKTMSVLCIKRAEFLFEFLRKKDDFINSMLNHIQTSAVMDLLLKFLTGVDNIDLRTSVVKWLNEKNLVDKLVAMFKSDCSAEQQVNAGQFLCDMIKASREHQSLLQDKADSDPLLEAVESVEAVSDLLTNMFATRTECALVNGISVLQSLLEYKRHSANIQQPLSQNNFQAPTGDFEAIPQCLAHPMFSRGDALGPDISLSPLDAERLAKGVRQVHLALVPRLSDFHGVLLNPPERPPVKTTVGVITKPLGATRLEVVHLIRALLTSNNPHVNHKLTELKTIPVLFDLFFSYPWNNFLHTQVEQSIKSILSNVKATSPVTSPDPEDAATAPLAQESTLLLIDQLLGDSHLIERILEAWALAESNNKQPRPGFMGHIIRIANHILDSSEESAVKERLNQLPPEVAEKWEAFSKGSLAEINKRIQTPLVNEVPSSTSTFDEDVMRQENALQQAFIEYQMQQMTRNLCTQIGFSANEFTELDENIQPQVDQLSKINFNLENQLQEQNKSANIFEQICSDRSKASIDSNSSDDEDLWEDRDVTFSQTAADQSKPPKFNAAFDGEVASSSANEMKMEVDQSDPWTDISSSCGNTMLMETGDPSDPWGGEHPKPHPTPVVPTSGEADSWADFSSFSTDFGLQPDMAPPNACVTSATPSSTESQFTSSSSGRIDSCAPFMPPPADATLNPNPEQQPESTTCEKDPTEEDPEMSCPAVDSSSSSSGGSSELHSHSLECKESPGQEEADEGATFGSSGLREDEAVSSSTAGSNILNGPH